MTQEPVIRSNDKTLLTKEYFIATKQALVTNPSVENIHFVILTRNENLRLTEPPREQFTQYDITITVELTPLREQHVNDIDMLTSAVLVCLFDKYKRDLVIH